MRYEVKCSVELVIEADDERHAKNKALDYVACNPVLPAGITQTTVWHLDVTDIDDTQPELEDEQKWERR